MDKLLNLDTRFVGCDGFGDDDTWLCNCKGGKTNITEEERAKFLEILVSNGEYLGWCKSQKRVSFHIIENKLKHEQALKGQIKIVVVHNIIKLVLSLRGKLMC